MWNEITRLNTAVEAQYKPTMQFPKRMKIQTNSGMNKNLVAWESFYPVTGHDCRTAMDAPCSSNVGEEDTSRKGVGFPWN